MHKLAALLNAVILFHFWLVVHCAGAHHPPPPNLVAVVLIDLVAFGLVYWRVPIYLACITSRRSNILLLVARSIICAKSSSPFRRQPHQR